jgi:hypothetical protein
MSRKQMKEVLRILVFLGFVFLAFVSRIGLVIVSVVLLAGFLNPKKFGISRFVNKTVDFLYDGMPQRGSE